MSDFLGDLTGILNVTSGTSTKAKVKTPAQTKTLPL